MKSHPSRLFRNKPSDNQEAISSQGKYLKMIKTLFWFFLGVAMGFFFFASFILIAYQKIYENKVYSGIFIDGKDFSGKTKNEVKDYFASRNQLFNNYIIEFNSATLSATISAGEIFHHDKELLAEQAYILGRSPKQTTNLALILNAYFNRINLRGAYVFDEEKLGKVLSEIKNNVEEEPVDALFAFENGRVVTFNLSRDGKKIDFPKLKKDLLAELVERGSRYSHYKIKIDIPLKILKPEVSNDNANSFGIQEEVGIGHSLFAHSISNRIYNINLAAKKLNGILINPGEVFSFNKSIGDISTLTGFRQAYIIENGRTVLGDGGGVCQVSTTLFRAALAAGLPIIERNSHAYRVSYYEQDSGPGIDAAVYSPSVDLKFKNDTDHHLLIQSFVDNANMTLTFTLYGTKDNRAVSINDPVILSQSPAPEPLYQDDPTLPKGTERQIDFAAAGAKVYFTRRVSKDGKEIINDKFVSNYRPWQAIFLRGTKEN